MANGDMTPEEIKKEEEKLADDKLKIETPLPPGKPRKPRKDKGLKKGTKDLSELEVKLIMIGALKGLSDSLAKVTGNPSWSMPKEHAENIDRAVNFWLKSRVPMLESKYKPEVVLGIAILGYLMYVGTETAARQKVIKKPEDKI